MINKQYIIDTKQIKSISITNLMKTEITILTEKHTYTFSYKTKEETTQFFTKLHKALNDNTIDSVTL